MDKYSLFWGPGVISMIDEPRGALTCRSPAVLADSDPFRGLLLTVLGSRIDFHDRRTPRCDYVSVINTRSFGRFWPVTWTITHCSGVPESFPRLPNSVVNTHSFCQFCPVSWTITYRFGAPKRFP